MKLVQIQSVPYPTEPPLIVTDSASDPLDTDGAANGHALVSLLEGDYAVEQIAAPPGYALAAPSVQSFIVTAATPATVTFTSGCQSTPQDLLRDGMDWTASPENPGSIAFSDHELRLLNHDFSAADLFAFCLAPGADTLPASFTLTGTMRLHDADRVANLWLISDNAASMPEVLGQPAIYARGVSYLEGVNLGNAQLAAAEPHDFIVDQDITVILAWDAPSHRVSLYLAQGAWHATMQGFIDPSLVPPGRYSLGFDGEEANAIPTNPGPVATLYSLVLEQPGPGIPIDPTPPDAQTLTFTETDPNVHRDGNTVYYNPTTSGSITVTSDASDPESGIGRVGFPPVNGSSGATDSQWPYATTYAWGPGASGSGDVAVTANNGLGMSGNSAFSMVPDGAAPDTTVTNPAANSQITPDQTIAIDASDSGAGVAQVEVRSCGGTTCEFANGTVIDSDETDPYNVTWNSQPADGTYTLVAPPTRSATPPTPPAPSTSTTARRALPPSP